MSNSSNHRVRAGNGNAAQLESNLNGKNTNSFIETENLSLYYRGKPAFKNVKLQIKSGCITALVGPSGCGKSSFLYSLNRLTDLISGCEVLGKIRINEFDVLDPKTDLTALRRSVGLIFQKPNPFPLSISKNIDLPLKEHGVKDKGKRNSIIEKVLTDVGLWDEVKDRLGAPALSLSGGQQQRLCIARALALEPEVLLLDEPCSALDPISSGVVEDLIMSLSGRYTILIVTHNLAQARRIADYTALFWSQDGVGNLVEYGPSKQFFENPQKELTSAYINGMRG
ncbi:MAG: phosphate ABC transporter ATP-binding protein [Thermodesulfobacteriota bacterium]